MQHFGRILTEDGVVPVILDGNQPLNLRPLVSDITPDVIASGALADVDTAHLSAVGGSVTYLAPIDGIRQVAATGFNYHRIQLLVSAPSYPRSALSETRRPARNEILHTLGITHRILPIID